MENKKLWLGILVITLVFGMTVVGCDDASSGKDHQPEFNLSITITEIPAGKNGNSFTMSLLDKDSTVFVSKGGSITGSEAKAEFIVKKMPSLSRFNPGTESGYAYTCSLTLKIGDDTSVSYSYDFNIYDGRVTESASLLYSRFH